MSPEDIIKTCLDKMTERSPRFQQLLDRAKAGEISEQDALGLMMQDLQEDPDLRRDLESIAQTALASMEAPQALVSRPPQGDMPEVFFKGAKGLPALNPLYEAGLAERAQFDGDMPELRFGPLPAGVMPAIPVKTAARQPAALGQMLKTASDQVRVEIDVHVAERRQSIEAVAASAPVLSLMEKHGASIADAAMENYGSPETDLAVYRRGQVPAPITVPTPSGSALAAMTPKERREHAWRFLSTTQGRRTALTVIRELVAKGLRGVGLTVVERDFDPKRTEEPLAAYEWSLKLSGPGATQDSFSVIDVASRALAKGLERKLAGLSLQQVTLEVIAVNAVDDRTVGWAARVLK